MRAIKLGCRKGPEKGRIALELVESSSEPAAKWDVADCGYEKERNLGTAKYGASAFASG